MNPTEAKDPSKPDGPSAPSLFGALADVLAFEIGRVVAIVGALIVGFVALSKAQTSSSPHDWTLLAVAGAIFVALAYVCRR